LIRVGVVGLGVFGRHHARHYAAREGVQLVAVADTDASRANAAAELSGATAFVDHRSLIGRVDAASVAVPATFHARVAGELLSAGIHVLVEKPITTESASARSLIARAERAGVVLQVGHVERFSPVVREIKRRVSEPRRIACVRWAPRSPRSADVDVVLDLMIHDIDHILTIAGAPLVTVAASGVSGAGGSTDEAEAWLTFRNGVVATLSASRVASETRRTLTVTEARSVYAGDLAAARLTVATRGGATIDTVTFPPHDNLAAEIAAFLDAVRGARSPEVDGAAGLAALAVARRIQAGIAEPALPVRERINA
jgi:predicted dehydrogenase